MEFRNEILPGGQALRELRPGFEERVWLRIRRQKRQRQTIVLTCSLLGVAALFFLLVPQHLFPPRSTALPMAQRVVSKEEIPLQEKLVFATYDRYQRYSLEKVSLATATATRNSQPRQKSI
jgi:hypothetical protein